MYYIGYKLCDNRTVLHTIFQDIYACNEDVLLTQIKSGLLNDTETYVGTRVSLRRSKLLNKEYVEVFTISSTQYNIFKPSFVILLVL
jgi:hypothetical protein